MSRLAHAALGAPGLAAEKRAAHEESQAIIVEAKRIQRELGCTWTEALRIAERKRPVITTDIDINEESDMETITLENDNATDIRFKGELIAKASSSANKASGRYSGATGRWTELKLYRTAGGRCVAQSIGHTQWQGEHTRYSAKVCETDADVIAFFGHGWLAKELYDGADIEDVQHVE